MAISNTKSMQRRFGRRSIQAVAGLVALVVASALYVPVFLLQTAMMADRVVMTKEESSRRLAGENQVSIASNNIKNKTTTIIPRAYVTLISSPAYEIGAQILVCRLRHYSPNIPIYVLIDESIEIPSATGFFETVMQAQVLRVSNPALAAAAAVDDRDATSGGAAATLALTQEVSVGTYTKLNVWRLADQGIQTAVYLDADTLPIQNPDVLFDMLPNDKDFAASGTPKYFNSGVFVFRPNLVTFEKLIHRLHHHDYQKQSNPTEQDLLVSHFGHTNTSFLNYRFIYRPSHDRSRFLDKGAIIVHWIGNPKPWSRILGKDTTIEGRGTTGTGRSGSTSWSMQLYQCEMERFFSICHTAQRPPSFVGQEKKEAPIQDCRTTILDNQWA